MSPLEAEVRAAYTVGRREGYYANEESRAVAQKLLEGDDEVIEAALEQFSETGTYQSELAENAITDIIERIK